MQSEGNPEGVHLPPGHTPTSYLHRLVMSAATTFPEAFREAELAESLATFSHSFAEQLTRFEAHRAVSPARAQIAELLGELVESDFCFDDGQGPRSLRAALSETTAPTLSLSRHHFPEAGPLIPNVGYEQRLFSGPRLAILIEELVQRSALTPKAAQGLSWIVRKAVREGGLSLRGQRFAVLGAGADLSPVPLLLEAGATVLWIGLKEPPAELLLDRRLSGTLLYPRGGVDIMRRPSAVRTALAQLAEEGPIHVWLCTHSRDDRRRFPLAATAKGIVRSLPPEAVKAVITLLSPAIPATIDPQDLEVADAEALEADRTRRLFARMAKLGVGHLPHQGIAIARAIVPMLGATHQAVHYVSRMLGAEALAVYGTQASKQPLTVSANVTPITRVRSLTHPLAEAALDGAKRFDVLVVEPATTRSLAALLALHDVLNPEAPGAKARTYTSEAARASALGAEQIHGGLYAQPYSLEGILRVTAMQEFGKQPQLFLRWLRGRT